jgi:hypothetical protein
MTNQSKKKKNRSNFKHNKKRNTAFLFEALVKELTKASISNDSKKRNAISSILKKHFKKSGVLYKELDLYRSVNEAKELDRITAERILSEAKSSHILIPQQDIFSAQSSLVDDINKEMGEDAYSNFVPNYKNLATLFQIFGDNISLKDRVLLENQIIRNMLESSEQTIQMQHINNLVYKSFTKKFNEAYSQELHKEQKDLLSKYVLSFVNNGLELKMFLNEEIGRLKKEVEDSKSTEEIKSDKDMIKAADEVLNMLGAFYKEQVTENQIKKILKIQKLVREVNS